MLAIVMTWPTAKAMSSTIPQDIFDPLLQAWEIAWGGHVLSDTQSVLWDANAFFPERSSLSFSDSLLGYAPLGAAGGSGPVAAVLRYNVLYILAHALAFTGAYALTRQAGAGILGALVAGMAFAYAPWRLAHAGHLNILSTGGIALALAILARGHGYSLRSGMERGRTRVRWILLGWATAAWQITLGFGIGIPFGYAIAVVLGIVALACLRRQRRLSHEAIAADIAGAGLFGATVAWMTGPYMRTAAEHPYAQRTLGEVIDFSPPPRGLWTAPAESWLWGGLHQSLRHGLTFPAEMTLLPGFVLLALAGVGLVCSVWPLRTRLWLAAAAVITGYLAVGTQSWGEGAYGYAFLYRHLPGLDAIRTPGRLIVWVTLFLAVMAAGSISAFWERFHNSADHPDRSIALKLAVLLPVALMAMEGWNTTPHPVVPVAPAAMTTARGPIMVLPSDNMTDHAVMLWSTSKFQKIVNGSSGFIPHGQESIRKASISFPSKESTEFLRRLGIQTVIVLRDRITGTPWEHTVLAPPPGVTRREHGDAVIYTLPAAGTDRGPRPPHGSAPSGANAPRPGPAAQRAP